MQNYSYEDEENKHGRLLASVELNISDPAKMQRGITNLLQQYRRNTGKSPLHRHPFLWYSRLAHPSSSPYTLLMDAEEATDNAVDEAFIDYITTCHSNQIEPFLEFQFQKFYNGLKASQTPQLFFDYVIALVEIANERGLLYKPEFDIIANWIGHNPDYNNTSVVPPSKPEYDIERINTDGDYAFAKLKALALYLPTIEPFTERIEWFFETSRIWGIEPAPMGVGNRMIPEREVFSRLTADRKPVDKNGQCVKEVAWGVNYNNDEERGIVHKLYFLRFYRPNVNKISNRICYNFDQLISKYITQTHTERSKRLVWEWVTKEINERQQIINDRFAADQSEYRTPEIRRQFQEMAVLIEQELEGISAIKWESFYRTDQLDPLCLLWGLVEYKRFLETEGQPTPATTGQQSKRPAAPSFANFTDKLRNGFTEESLNGLLVHMLMKNSEGQTLSFEKYLLHPVIDALINEGYFEKGNREADQKALCKFLLLKETRIKSGCGKPGIEVEARLKATTYLKKEREKNGSNPVP